MTRLSIMGVGKVGGEVAFLAAALGIIDELNIYDTYRPLLNAQVLDLSHTGIDINITTEPAEFCDADIFVFAAGSPRTPDIKTRADLLEANRPVADACSEYLEGFDGILITITNPMDANNYYLHKKTGIERSRCIGFGGMLDSARYGCFMAERGIPGEAWVLGEHGEHQVPLFSNLSVDVPVSERDAILEQMRTSSMGVIKGKGGTVFGPAYHIVSLIRAVAEDSGEILPCSCVLEGEYGYDDCSIGVPARVGKDGIREIVEWDLDEWEQEKFDDAVAFQQALCRRAYE